MLVRWLRADECERLASLGADEGWIISSDEIQKSQKRFPHLCFGAEVGGVFVGGLTSYLHEKSAWIGNFIVDKNFRGQGIGKALFESVMRALGLERQSVYLHAAPSAIGFYDGFGFKATREIVRLTLVPNGKALHEKSFLSELSSECGGGVMNSFDKKAFGEDRKTLLEDVQTKSSLLLSCPNGFCHTKVTGQVLCIGPWEMASGAYLDAEKMLRTVLSVRGQKAIFADVPAEASDIIALYESYGFIESGRTLQMCFGTPLALKYENIYAFASLGSKG